MGNSPSKADLVKKDENGLTLLSRCAFFGKLDQVKRLVDAGADIESRDTAGDTPLTLASVNGQTGVVQLLLERKANIEHREVNGATPLSLASISGHTDIVQLLLNRGANIESRESHGVAPLSLASGVGHVRIVKLLLESGADIETKDNNGFFPLYNAVQEGHISTVKLLLDKGANTETSIPSGVTALSKASHTGHAGVVKLLLDRGANIEHRDSNGNTPLSIASLKGHNDVVQLLLEKGANAAVKNNLGLTPLDLAKVAGHPNVVSLLLAHLLQQAINLWVASREGNINDVRSLLKRGANIETRDPSGDTPLSIASYMGRASLVKWLLEKGANIETRDENDRSPLSLASGLGHADVVQSLLAFGAEIETKDHIGLVPLMAATLGGHEPIVRLLLNRGANIEARDSDGDTPLSLASLKGHTSIVELLLESGADPETKDNNGLCSVWKAALVGHEEIAKLILNRRANAEERTLGEFPALIIASLMGHTGIVKLLLEFGADPDPIDPNDDTPLSIASLIGHAGIVKLLLESGADIETKDDKGFFPLYNAAQEGHKRVVRLLLNRRANTEASIPSGFTALSIASHKGHAGVVQLLLDRGANVAVEDVFGRTPLALARSEGHSNVEHLLTLAESNTLLLIASEQGNQNDVSSSLKRGANIETRDANGSTLLSKASFGGHCDVVKLLLDNGADIKGQDVNGDTPLCIACMQGYRDVVALLLEHGADIEGKDANRDTPLCIACMQGHRDVVALLLEHGADIEGKDADRNTPLCRACFKGHKNVASLLLEHGANIEVANKDGYFPLYFAAKNNHLQLTRFLIEKGATIDNHFESPLHVSSECGHKAIVGCLLDSNANIERRDKKGHSPLMLAAINGQTDVAKVLVDHGADRESRDNENYSAMELSVIHGHVDTLQFFLSFITDPRERKNVGKILVALAGTNSQLSVISSLFDTLPDLILDFKGSFGIVDCAISVMCGIVEKVNDFLSSLADDGKKTSLIEKIVSLAACKGQQDIISCVVDHYQEVNLDYKESTPGGLPPFAEAISHSHFDCVRLLYSLGATWGDIGLEKRRECIAQSRSVDIYKYVLLAEPSLQSESKVHDHLLFNDDIDWNIIEESLSPSRQMGMPRKPLSSFVMTKGVGSVRHLDDKIRNRLIDEVSTAVTKLTEPACKHWKIKSPILVGSSAESSKVGLPDEMDFQFQQDREVPPGDLKDVGDIDRPSCFRQFKVDGGPRELRENSKLFHAGFWKKIPVDKHDMVFSFPTAVAGDGAASSPMKMVWPKKDAPQSLIVDIDLVPSLHVDDWPDDAVQKTWSMGREEFKKHGYVLVAKPPAKNSDFGKKFTDAEREKLYTMSFSTVEIEHISKLKHRVRDAFILAKCVRNPVVCRVVVRDADGVIHFVDSLITSYFLKTVFLHNVEDFRRHRRPLIEMVYIIYCQLEYYLSHGFIPLFWMPKVNLLEGSKTNAARSQKMAAHMKSFLAGEYREELKKDPPTNVNDKIKTLIPEYCTRIATSSSDEIQILSVPLKENVEVSLLWQSEPSVTENFAFHPFIGKEGIGLVMRSEVSTNTKEEHVVEPRTTPLKHSQRSNALVVVNKMRPQIPLLRQSEKTITVKNETVLSIFTPTDLGLAFPSMRSKTSTREEKKKIIEPIPNPVPRRSGRYVPPENSARSRVAYVHDSDTSFTAEGRTDVFHRTDHTLTRLKISGEMKRKDAIGVRLRLPRLGDSDEDQSTNALTVGLGLDLLGQFASGEN